MTRTTTSAGPGAEVLGSGAGMSPDSVHPSPPASEAARLPDSLVFAVLAATLIPLALHFAGSDFSSSRSWEILYPGHRAPAALAQWTPSIPPGFGHGLLEWTSVCLAIITAYLAFLCFHFRTDFLVLALALALLLSGLLDGFHTLAADLLAAISARDEVWIPITWTLSRLLKSSIVLLGVVFLFVSGGGARRRGLLVIAAGALLAALASLELARFSLGAEPPPRAYFPDAWASRPWDLAPLPLLGAAAALLSVHLNRSGSALIPHALLVSLFPDTVAQLHMALGSTQLYDSHFYLAHALKIVGGLVLLVGFSLHLIQAYRREVVASERLERTIARLEREVRERRNTENELRSKEVRFRELTENIREVFWISSSDERQIQYVSPAYEEIFGRSCQSLYDQGQSFLELIHPEDRERVLATIGREPPENVDVEYRIVRDDGSVRWIHTRAFCIRNEQGEVYRMAGISEDVTEKKQADVALRRSEARNQALLNAVPDFMFLFSRDGRYLDYHAREPDVTCFPPGKFMGRRLSEVSPVMGKRMEETIRQALESGEMQILEYNVPVRGRQRDYEARFMPSGYDEVVVIVRDITEHKRLEREILEISSREQERIGQDLHDGLSQQLTGIALLSKALHRRLGSRGLPEAEDALRISELVKDAIGKTRGLARGLTPVHLEEQGLSVALQELAEGIEELYGVACRFRCGEDVSMPDHTTATHLYRIAQEAVTNALKHGEPRQITVELEGRNASLVLEVSDDGRGMSGEGEVQKGMGLHIMRYRARMIDARLDIRSDPGKGTRVICSFQPSAVRHEAGVS